MEQVLNGSMVELRRRAKVIWTGAWLLLLVLVSGIGLAVATGWIYVSVQRFLIVPGGCFGFLTFLLIGARWALNAAPGEPHRVIRVSTRAKKVAAINGVAIVIGAGVWAAIDGSAKPVVLVAMAAVLAGLAFLWMFAVAYSAYLASLYTRRDGVYPALSDNS